ncbi:PucR family transcriptional regulator [Amycolatopsis sp. NPDC004747]
MRSEAARWIAGYAEQALVPAELSRLIEMTDREITTEVADYAAGEDLRRDLHASTSAHWREFLVAVTRDPFEVRLPPEAFDLARTIARRGLGLTVLLKTYRVAQRAVWSYVTGIVQDEIADGDLRSAVLVRFWDRVGRWIDSSVEVLVGTYSEEREQWQRGALAQRAEAVHAILRGDDVDLDATSVLLGHPLRRHHTAFVLWAEDGTPAADVVRALEGSAAAFGAALGTAHPLSVAGGARGLWCWVATAGPPDPEALAAVTPRPGVRAAVGGAAPGVDGFRRSHREAQAAQTAALTGGAGAPLTRYADVELACLAGGIGGMEAMRVMVARELAGLAAADDATSRLRRTVRVYLANGASAELAGKALNLHRNTVRYRVQQAEQLLGHPVLERRTHLELALHCLDVFGR